ncbi:hypothetical protein BDV18DRAFT_80436 [Aspergillus unguis]
MDNVSQKRPQQAGSESLPPSTSISLPNRSRSDKNPATSDGTGRREVSASSAVNARTGTSATHSDDDEDDDDYTSSSGSSLSSDDEDGESDNDDQTDAAGNNGLNNDEGITSLPARRKPNICRLNQEPSLLSRLSAFLPQMKTANEDLEKEIAAGRAKDIQLDDEEEGEDQKDGQYIEMNLGLGVLEEKRPGDESDNEQETNSPTGPHESNQDTNLMDRLMGKDKASSEKPSIQDLGN